jgi:putative endonuclease
LSAHFFSANAHRIGSIGEQLACLYVRAHGYQRYSSNYRCQGGEIDLIMLKKNLLLFIEVKSRLYKEGTHGLLRITPKKQKRILHTAEHFLHHHSPTSDLDVRFDAILVQIFPLSIAWHTNIF